MKYEIKQSRSSQEIWKDRKCNRKYKHHLERSSSQESSLACPAYLFPLHALWHLVLYSYKSSHFTVLQGSICPPPFPNVSFLSTEIFNIPISQYLVSLRYLVGVEVNRMNRKLCLYCDSIVQELLNSRRGQKSSKWKSQETGWVIYLHTIIHIRSSNYCFILVI